MRIYFWEVMERMQTGARKCSGTLRPDRLPRLESCSFPADSWSTNVSYMSGRTGDDEGDKRLASGKSAVKNRLAQQRYRAKQKEKMKEYQDQIDALSQRLVQLEMKNQALERLSHAAGTASPQHQESDELEREPWQSRATPAALCNLVNGIRRGNGPAVTEAEAARFIPSNLENIRHEYVTNLAFLLAKGSIPGTPAAKELHDYVTVQRANWFAVIESLTTESLAHMLKQRSPLKLFKESMVTAMQLQPDQIRALQKFRQQIQQELAAIAAERREITLMLSKTVVSNFGTEKHDERRHVGFLQRLQACDRLKETLQAERGCYIKMKHTFWQILTPLQEARALVEGFPDTRLDGMMVSEYLEADTMGTKQQWLDSLADRECLEQQRHHHQRQRQAQVQPLPNTLQTAASSSTSWQSGPETGQPQATPFEAGAQITGTVSGSSDAERGVAVSDDFLEVFPPVPLEDLEGLGPKEVDDWLSGWGGATPRLELFG